MYVQCRNFLHVCTFSFHLHKNLIKVITVSIFTIPFYRRGNWGLESSVVCLKSHPSRHRAAILQQAPLRPV